MINKYPLWKYLLLAAVVMAGCLFALPNLYGDDPAVQISPRNGVLAADLESGVRSTLEQAGVEDFRVRVEDERMLVLFADGDDQLKGRDVIQQNHSDRNTVALNLVPATPAWLRSIAKPMGLGLDLRGGVHFLMEVDIAAAITQAEAKYIDDFRTFLRGRDIRYRGARQSEAGVRVRFDDAARRDAALAAIRSEYFDLELNTAEDGGDFYIDAKLTELALSLIHI